MAVIVSFYLSRAESMYEHHKYYTQRSVFRQKARHSGRMYYFEQKTAIRNATEGLIVVRFYFLCCSLDILMVQYGVIVILGFIAYYHNVTSI